MCMLELKGIDAGYQTSQVLSDINLNVAQGQLVALLGRNGMGKTTTIRVICRMLKATKGTLMFDSRNLANLPSFAVSRLGIGLVPEGRRCFASLTVEENLLASARRGEWTIQQVYELFPQLKEKHNQLARTLSGGEQQMLSIGRALMTNPRLLLMDEATEGLAPMVRNEIWNVISTLKRQSDMAILLIDKPIKEIKTLADYCVIIERGRNVWSGPPMELTDALTNQYLGI
ncbi:MAG: ABC transporter ATP-binding protein [Rhodobacteraceae bacterium]|nr:ABC transporter ATP-binding protein [Paracoccaceae bacterium]